MQNHIKHLLPPDQYAQHCEAFEGRPAPPLPAAFWAIRIVDHIIENEVRRDGNRFIVPQHTPAFAARALVLRTYYKLYPAKECDPVEAAKFIWEVMGHLSDHFQKDRPEVSRDLIEFELWAAYEERALCHNSNYALFEDYERENAFLPYKDEIMKALGIAPELEGWPDSL